MPTDVRCKTVLLNESPLTGEYTTPLGVQLVSGDRVLAAGQGDPTQKDLYVVSAEQWSRDTETPLSRWMDVGIDEGIGVAGDIWTLSTEPSAAEPAYPRDGTAPLHFELRQRQPHPRFTTGLEETPEGYVRLIEWPGVEGNYPWGTVNKNGVVTEVTDAETNATYLEGLRVEWVAANSVRVKQGSAFAPGSGQLTLDGDLLLEFPANGALAANTWYYLYLFENNGSVQAQVSTQRPADPYLGRARTKGGPDNADPNVAPVETHRYIGEIYASAANTIRRFVDVGNGRVMWAAAPRGDLNTGVATSTITAEYSLAAWLPRTSDVVRLEAFYRNVGNNSTFHLSSAASGLMSVGGQTGNGEMQVNTAASNGSRYAVVDDLWLGFDNQAVRVRQAATAASGSVECEIIARGYARMR